MQLGELLGNGLSARDQLFFLFCVMTKSLGLYRERISVWAPLSFENSEKLLNERWHVHTIKSRPIYSGQTT